MKNVIKSVARINNVIYVTTKSNQVRQYIMSSTESAIKYYNELTM